MIPPEVEAELDRIEREFSGFQAGTVDPDAFKRFRLENGVYGIRDSTDEFMIRVKIRFGALNSEQLEALAEVAQNHTPLKLGHITTRQDMQFHRVKGAEVPSALRKLAEVGLTTREACGNTVRNVTSCPYAGISPEEAFDVTPYADQVSRYFLRNPVCQNLPRKFKIAFEGCRTDHARTPIHDLGAVAARGENGRPGFRLYVGGGLGPAPMAAQRLEPFTPAEILIPSIEAALRLFDRHGERAHKDRARIKFMVKSWGIEDFRKRWESERKVVLATASGLNQVQWEIPVQQEVPPSRPTPPASGSRPQVSTWTDYPRWVQTNVLPQKQAGYVAVTIRCPLGDITASQMREVAQLARHLCLPASERALWQAGGGRIRTTIGQNLLLHWVRAEDLPILYPGLIQAGLTLSGAETLQDITRCPGADTCNLAITHSRGLATALGELFLKEAELLSDPTLSSLSLKISGCPNSCGQHHIADIGFYGAAKVLSGRAVPHYRLLLGGGTAEGQALFGATVATIPAQRVPDAVKRILTLYRSGRRDGEPFRAWVGRVGVAQLQAELDRFAEIPPYAEQPKLYEDLGEPGVFKVQVGKGECAA